MTLRFRAMLIGTKNPLPRPIQTLHPTMEDAKAWSRMIFETHPDRNDWGNEAAVKIYETTETVVWTHCPKCPATPERYETKTAQKKV